jgi:hypothetical protein
MPVETHGGWPIVPNDTVGAMAYFRSLTIRTNFKKENPSLTDEQCELLEVLERLTMCMKHSKVCQRKSPDWICTCGCDPLQMMGMRLVNKISGIRVFGDVE